MRINENGLTSVMWRMNGQSNEQCVIQRDTRHGFRRGIKRSSDIGSCTRFLLDYMHRKVEEILLRLFQVSYMDELSMFHFPKLAKEVISSDKREAWWETIWWPWVLELVLPARTQPNCIANAIWEPGGPIHRPCSKTSTIKHIHFKKVVDPTRASKVWIS